MTKLMLVEDDNNLREIYEARLQAEGYEIVSARDGEEALVVAKAEKPDLIISDVMMPKISGFEMLDIIRNTDELKHVKVIMLTALGQSADQQRADKLGADKYLVKSQVTLEDIVKVAHELLGDAEPEAEASDPATTDTTSPIPTQTPAEPVAAEPSSTPSPEPATSAPTPEPVVAAPAPATEPVSPPAEPEPAPSPEPATPTPEPVTPVPPTSPEPEPSIPAVEAPVPSPTPEPEASTEPANITEPAAPSIEIPFEPAATDPVATEPAAADTALNDSQSTAQEEATVEAEIESFVAGAGAPDDVATPDSSDSDNTASDSSDTDSATTETDEPTSGHQLLSMDDQKQDPDEPIVYEPTEPPEVKTPVEPEPEKPTAKKVGGERVIEPIDSEPKKDIDTLLAVEEAKEAKNNPITAAPIIVDDKAGPQTELPESKPGDPKPVAPGTTIDPNSISL